MQNIILRIADEKDIPALYRIAAAMKATHEPQYFERCFAEGRRTVVIAEDAGYALLNWEPTYTPFRRLGFPEIQDLNVVPAARKAGVGGKLVGWCESLALQEGKTDIGISVGLSSSYGAAQRLYVKMGYVPDGAGIAYDDVPVAPGEMRAVDGLLTLKFVKSLS